MAAIKSIHDVDLKGKRVLVRVDFNVPIRDGKVGDDTRITATLPTIRELLAAGSRVILVSHLGRPVEGEFDEQFSLAPVAARLAELLSRPVPLIRDWQTNYTPGAEPLAMLENIRFVKGEKKNKDEAGKALAALCDVYVNDAFATAHRAESSTHGVAKFAPVACAGPLLMREVEALGRAVRNPQPPVVAIVGGSKISTKLTVLENLLAKVDRLIVGGGIANTFLAASGVAIGKSLNEPGLEQVARDLLDKAKRAGKEIPLPTDVVVAAEVSEGAVTRTVPVTAVGPSEMILDIGPETAARYAALLAEAKTIIWNGPVGVFEFTPFSAGTRRLAEAIAKSHAFSLAGGGDTLAAITQFGVGKDISYISTGGGAFLEFLEGKTLPALAILEERA
ncbi:MAG: phosphoglycerate kinase [Gammaproteobacteria bacterium]|jgi:phosphoglycerate kinase|nr:MAG: phosphoglycerate kinase [Gammaproteobacteria bacterium]